MIHCSFCTKRGAQLMHIDLQLMSIFIGKILNETLARTVHYSNIGYICFILFENYNVTVCLCECCHLSTCACACVSLVVSSGMTCFHAMNL